MLNYGRGSVKDGPAAPAAHAPTHLPSGTDPLTTAAAGTIEPDDAAAVGVAESFARSDHQHAIVAAIAIAVASANAEGVATSFARSDHAHDARTLPTQIADLNMGDNDISNVLTVTFQDEHDNGNSGAADTINWNNGQKQLSTLTDNVTFTFTDPAGPCNLVFHLIQDAGGTNTATWPASVKWPGGTAPVISAGALAEDIVTFYFDGTDYFGGFLQNYS